MLDAGRRTPYHIEDIYRMCDFTQEIGEAVERLGGKRVLRNVSVILIRKFESELKFSRLNITHHLMMLGVMPANDLSTVE